MGSRKRDPQGSYEGSTPEDTCAANLVSSWSRLEVIRRLSERFLQNEAFVRIPNVFACTERRLHNWEKSLAIDL